MPLTKINVRKVQLVTVYLVNYLTTILVHNTTYHKCVYTRMIVTARACGRHMHASITRIHYTERVYY